MVSAIKNVLTVSSFNLYQHFLSQFRFTFIFVPENSTAIYRCEIKGIF